MKQLIMKQLIMGSLTGGLAAAAVVATLFSEDQGHTNRAFLATESQPPLAQEQANLVADLRTTLGTVREDMNALKSEITAVRSQQAGLKLDYEKLATDVSAQISRLGQAVESVSRASVPAAPGPAIAAGVPEEPQATVAEESATQLDRLVTLDNTMYAQVPDPVWDDEAAWQLTDSFRRAGFERSQLQGVVCQGVMCRVEIYHDDETALADLFDGEQELVTWSHQGRMETIEHASGELTTVMYLTREGFEFPGGF